MVHKLHIIQDIPVSKFRSIASQVIACMSCNMLLLDLGMAVSFSTIALPDLLNAKEGLSLNEDQASWFGSLAFLTQPLGALFSGPLVDYFGRKKATFIVNIPHLVAWILMYYAWNVPALFLANGLLGLGTGIMESPINAYVGEISESSIRGALCTTTQVFTSVGILVMYFLGVVVPWRQAALVCLVAPVLSMAWVVFNLVPETPVWLLVRNREKDALKSLCFLRGWTTQENVREEYDALVEYAKTLKQCIICYKTDSKESELNECEHMKMNFVKKAILKFRYVMLSKETLRPFSFIMSYFAFLVMSGLAPIRPNLVNVCDAFGMATGGKNVALMVGVITVVVCVVVAGTIKFLGKRKLCIGAMLGTAVFTLALSIYAKVNLDDTVFSYDVSTFPKEKSYVPLFLFYMMTVFTALAIPWVLFGEVFPFRSRASAQGLAAAGNYVITFIAAKTLINLETTVQLWGAFAVYAAFAFVGTVYLYFFLPETEGKTLQEIENYYNGEFRTFADDPVINYFKRFKR
ncbi:unnamed protein product [Plutella xylostella]|uniref:(diamondback moth) hypothetical protein n=1 Tax=Plutella xylostella TaxID=51655 RepID=A0A8S4EAB8_PLUXY|nr:unnamed protein product [Plutella xylostella]